MSRQLEILKVSRSSHYYKNKVNHHRECVNSRVEDEIVEIYQECPFYGVPRLTAELNKRGYKVNHKRVRRLHKKLGLKTIYPRPHFNTSEPTPEHEKFPYLLSNVEIERPNHVWSTDITYTGVAGNRAFVIAILDWFSRKILAYSVTNTMDAYHCVETLETAMRRHGQPDIFNSDQGSQFTSKEFINVLKSKEIKISMDGRGRCLDNAKMERFWWALKYEDIKIKEYISLPQLRLGVQNYVNFYNTKRIHSALEYQTPDEVYFKTCNPRSGAYSNAKVFTPIFQ